MKRDTSMVLTERFFELVAKKLQEQTDLYAGWVGEAVTAEAVKHYKNKTIINKMIIPRSYFNIILKDLKAKENEYDHLVTEPSYGGRLIITYEPLDPVEVE